MSYPRPGKGQNCFPDFDIYNKTDIVICILVRIPWKM